MATKSGNVKGPTEAGEIRRPGAAPGHRGPRRALRAVRAVAVFWLAVGLNLGGCATRRMPLSDPTPQELAGHYVSGTGESWFTPCGAAPEDAPWWVTVTGRAVEQLDGAKSGGRFSSGHRYFVRWRATVTTDGQVGPRGPGVPALLVRELIELRAPSVDDCAERNSRTTSE